MNKETKAAKRFVKTFLKENVNFEAVSNYINKIGYTINFYNHDETNSLLEKYKLSDFSKNVRAFTIKAKDAKIVFIDKSISTENKLRALLHETAHIVLGHMDISSTIADTRLHDMQAETFAYTALTYKKDYKTLRHIICLIATSAISGIIAYNYQPHAVQQIEPYIIHETTLKSQSTESVENLVISNPESESVYVTKSGTRYHKPDCQYVRNNNSSMPITIEEANKSYIPCKVCKP